MTMRTILTHIHPILSTSMSTRHVFAIIASNSNSYKFGTVIALADVINSNSDLLKGGSLSFTIHVLPAPTSHLSIETRFLLATRQK